MKIELQGEKISIQNDEGDSLSLTAKEIFMLSNLSNSLFSENRTHVYLKVSDYNRLKRIREIGIELLNEVKKTGRTGATAEVISKFHDFKFAIFTKEMNP